MRRCSPEPGAFCLCVCWHDLVSWCFTTATEWNVNINQLHDNGDPNDPQFDSLEVTCLRNKRTLPRIQRDSSSVLFTK